MQCFRLLTLVLYHVSPLVRDALGGFLGFFGGEYHQALVLGDHLADQRPVVSVLGHARDREPVLEQPRSIENLCKTHGGRDIIFDEDCYDFRRVRFEKVSDFAEHIDGRLLRMHMQAVCLKMSEKEAKEMKEDIYRVLWH